VACALALILASCDKPDASHVTSPSAQALLGTTTGNVLYSPDLAPPEPVAAPDGWDFELGNARFSELEDGAASIQVVTLIQSRPGPAMEFWIASESGTVVRWSGGSARRFEGTFCFQLRLEEGAEALPLQRGERYTFTIAFRDPGTEEVVLASRVQVAGTVPLLDGGPPGPGSPVARDLLGCPRSVI
jgi:hypothetical protein